MLEERIPVSIITGFLGAGKTTLLNQLIKKYSNKKFAIIENEIGEIGIDGGLIIGADNNIFELSNGCICCSMNDDFYKTIYSLIEGTYEFNHLLIETTGIADPDSIIQAFISTEKIQQHFILDSVICIADAVNLEDELNEQPEVYRQLALADVILLNKIGDVSIVYATELVNTVVAVNPLAKIFRVSYSDISNIDLLDQFLYTEKAIEKTTLSYQNLTLLKAQAESQSFKLVEHHKHHHQIMTESFIIPGGFDYDRFTFWIRNYIIFNPTTVFRIKGIIAFHQMDDQYIFHSVRSEYLLDKAKAWNDEMRFSKLIFIGKKLDRDALEDHLYKLLPRPSAANV